ncbi:restriction endonuclease [Methanobacterium bryantii]|uniref:Restriction endonuclease n=2 Tax=Methanobacterium bryantii TaxID=2161 RepID=A0A2A2H7V1_METBR|nr:restriction endonuclease [Methanobacterium bryantii]
MVRAGQNAFLIDDFKSKNIVAIGWDEIGDLSACKSHNAVKKLVNKKYPEFKEGKVNITASQINKFRFEFNKGEYVVSYNPEERIYLIGEISSDYIFKENSTRHNHIREVKWIGNVNRDDLSVSTRNTLGAISTIFEINGDASSEMISVINGKKVFRDEEEEDAEEGTLKEDMVLKSHEFIKDRVLSLDWDEMQELIAGILRSMGYKTMVSPRGPDRGRDVLASPDGLLLKEPRIAVEVKHRKGQMGAPEIRGFTGGLRPGDKGLYVSTGGFTREAKYEADRSNIPLTLIDSDLLVTLIIQYYDNFDSDTRTLIPLTKIYWPI